MERQARLYQTHFKKQKLLAIVERIRGKVEQMGVGVRIVGLDPVRVVLAIETNQSPDDIMRTVYLLDERIEGVSLNGRTLIVEMLHEWYVPDSEKSEDYEA